MVDDIDGICYIDSVNRETGKKLLHRGIDMITSKKQAKAMIEKTLQDKDLNIKGYYDLSYGETTIIADVLQSLFMLREKRTNYEKSGILHRIILLYGVVQFQNGFTFLERIYKEEI